MQVVSCDNLIVWLPRVWQYILYGAYSREKNKWDYKGLEIFITHS